MGDSRLLEIQYKFPCSPSSPIPTSRSTNTSQSYPDPRQSRIPSVRNFLVPIHCHGVLPRPDDKRCIRRLVHRFAIHRITAPGGFELIASRASPGDRSAALGITTIKQQAIVPITGGSLLGHMFVLPVQIAECLRFIPTTQA
jgi:hypothetical protein